MTESFVQLFEKLSLQGGSGGDEPVKKEKAADHPPADPKTAPKAVSAQPTSVRGDGRTAESKLSEAVKTKQDKHKASLKAQGSQTRQKTDSQTYGKVYTRHINQLFIRGENVLLVNPQPL